MKSRVALLVALMVAYAASGFAQGNVWGVKGGVNIASATQAGQDPLKNAAGGIGGLFMRTGVSFAGKPIQPEILLSRQGGSGNGEDFRVYLNYLQIPVLLHFGLSDTGARPFIMVGPALGIRLTARAKGQDLSDGIKRIDAGITAGGGLFVSSRVSLEGRYTQGLMDIATAAGHAGDIGPGTVRNRVISIMLGIEIPR
jgi:Outer membrane protein beta-barrel domain